MSYKRKMQNNPYRKYLVFVVTLLFIGSGIVPSISGDIKTFNKSVGTNDIKQFTGDVESTKNLKNNEMQTDKAEETAPKTAPKRGYNDVYFNSSFEMGNLINIQYQTGDASGQRHYTAEINYSTINFSDKHWWFYFSMENTTGKTITVELQNLAPEDFGTGDGLPRWQSIEPIYSYNDKDWSRVPLTNISWNSTALNFSITITPTQDKIWIAPIPPYTITMRDTLFTSYASSTYLNVSSLGITPLGQNITLATITDPTVDDEGKYKIYMISQQQGGETVPSFVTKGMIQFLLDETSPTAEALRKNCIFKIIPVVNVDGVYFGIGRYTPVRDGTQYDLNREWHLPVDDMQPEVNWIFSDIETWSPDVFMDLHDHSTAEDCFFYKGQDPPDSNMTFFMDSIGTYWPETDKSRLTTDKSAGQVYDRLGINLSVIMEHPHDNITSTPEHPVDHNPQTIADWHSWGEGIALGLRDYFGITEDVLLVDSEFNESTNSTDLRNNAMGRDWYESRNSNPTLLTLNTSNVGRNSGKKAALKGYGMSSTAYLTQEFSSAQNESFNVSFDIYIDKISNYSKYDRTGFIFIGDDSAGSNGPCSTGSERFIYLTFYDGTPGDSGNDLEIRARENSTNQSWSNTSTWTSIVTGLSYDTWYTIKLEIDFANSTYDVYVDDLLKTSNISGYEEYGSPYLTDISFSVGGTARGDFYVDNVFAPAVNRHKLDIEIIGGGSVATDPGEATYMNGTVVELNATADPGWSFSHWSGDLSGSDNPGTITLTRDMNVTATFIEDEYTLIINYEGNGSVVKYPDQATYLYGTVVELNATADPGWMFSHWSGNLIGSDNPTTITMTDNMMVTANFTQDAYVLTIIYEGNGSVVKYPDQATYLYGTVVELNATADTGWSFDHWAGNMAGTTNPDSIVITDNLMVVANFTRNEYTLAILTEGNGTVVKYPDQATYHYNDIVQLHAIANTSWIFNHWSGNLTGGKNPEYLMIAGNMTVTANFTSAILLVDPEFSDSVDSDDLRANSTSQDWYESRNNDSSVLTLDTSNILGNTGKKAALKGFEIPGYAYLTQEFSSPPASAFTVSLDICIDRIEDYGDYDCAGYIYIGDDSRNYTSDDAGKGPCSTSRERFVLLTFYDGGGTGSNLGIRAREYNAPIQSWNDTSTWTEVTSDLSYDSWHTIKLIIDVSGGTYDVYVDGVLKGDDIKKYEDYTSGSVSHISFSAGGTGRGDFYVDNVFTPATERYTLDVNTIGGGTVLVDPGEAKYAAGTVVELNATAYAGWSFDRWEGNLTGSANPTTITMDDNKSVTAVFTTGNVVPTVQTENATDITNTSANLQGYLIDDGEEACSVWFEWDAYETDECMGTIATGSVCKDGRSILHKNRHTKADNQRPRFFKGPNYSYFGVGHDDRPFMNRMGQNEKGLAIASADYWGTIDMDNLIENTTAYTSDRSVAEDNSYHHCLGNYETVKDAAEWLARHSRYNGNYWIISSEPGVGAVVCLDSTGNSAITWVNNSYAALANVFYCNGGHDHDLNDVTAEKVMRDIVENGTSSDGDHFLNWQDIAQRVAKNTRDKEKGDGTFYVGSYGGEISNGACRSSLVSVAGNSSFNNSVHMSWLAFGKTTQLSIFLPLYAGNLHSVDDIPVEFGNDSGTNPGIQPYVDVKEAYANEGLSTNWYHCDRVREILEYACYNENITFDEFDDQMDAVMSFADEDEVKSSLAAFVNETLPPALSGYINNVSTSATSTEKQYPQGIGAFNETITGLQPGTVYCFKAYANNSVYSSDGSQLLLMTKPDDPRNALATAYNNTQINLSWTKGIGAQNTVIERNIAAMWSVGEGTEIYNGTDSSYYDTGLLAGAHYYYQLWSYTSHEGLYQYSSDSATTDNTTTGKLVLIKDSEFDDSVNSSDLRDDSPDQDWYESRNDDPTLLTLDTDNIGGNSGKKAALKNYGITSNAYLAQEFSLAQTETFNLSFDILIDRIEYSGGYDRSGLIYIGDDRITTDAPTGTSNERFVFMTFYDSTPGDSGDDLEIRARTLSGQAYGTTSQWSLIASGLSYDTWYTVKIEIDVAGGMYDVYVDGVLLGDDIPKYSGYTPVSVEFISFAVDSDGRGDFFVDNVFSPSVDRYKLNVNIVGNGSVTVDPGEATYANGTVVQLTAFADPGWSFLNWSVDLTSSVNPEYITMDGNKTVTATFTEDQYTLTVNVVGNGSVFKSPDQAFYVYGDMVQLTAVADLGWSFAGWSVELSGSVNPENITMDGDKTVNATFTLLPPIENYTIPLSVGWNLISLPVNQSYNKDNIIVNYHGDNLTWQQAVENNTVLGFVYEWDTNIQNYDFADILNPGEGYWMYANDDCDLLISSNISDNDEYITDLSVGWNLIGLPYDKLVAKENITVYYNGIEYTWQQAVDNSTVLGFIYGWNAIDQGYEFSDILHPGKGYWLYTFYNCTLLYQTTS